MVVLSCIALSVGCAGTEEGVGASANTEVELLISDPDTPPEELLLLIDFVSYRITCLESGLAPYDDSIDLAGNFEVDADVSPPVWQLATDLPLSTCSIALWVFYDDEVVCQGSEVLPIVDDASPLAPNKVNILLECNLSVNGPSADLDVDGSFDFIHGNYCPKLTWLGAVPPIVEAAVPPVTSIEALAFDPDSTCGLNCDPQTCDFTQNPPLCTAAPDPGFTTTLVAPAGKGSFDFPVATGTQMTGGTPIDAQATFTCDPLFPGPTEICVTASDGDNDCDQMRCITIICPDLCEDAATRCEDGNECTGDFCDPLTGTCTNVDAPNGIACDFCNSTCQGGACDAGVPFTALQNASVMTFTGNMQFFDATLVNPYSGASRVVSGNFNVNVSSYKGVGADDLLVGTALGDVLLVNGPPGAQVLCGVETLTPENSFDVLMLADSFITLQDMVIDGGNAGDLIWANVGNDTIFGNNGIDEIDGGPGDDVIEGGLGNDIITLWPGCGFDSIDGGTGVIDTIKILGIQSQVTITPAANYPTYEFDLFFLGTPMAQIRTAELLVMDDASIDLTLCTGPPTDVCNLCGNDALNGGEECDDGNNVDGDGCAADCTAEY